MLLSAEALPVAQSLAVQALAMGERMVTVHVVTEQDVKLRLYLASLSVSRGWQGMNPNLIESL